MSIVVPPNERVVDDARALAERGNNGTYWRQEFPGLTRLAERQRFASNDGRR